MFKGIGSGLNIVGLVAMLALAACGPRPNDAAFLSRGGPESLLDVSSEAVNLNVGSKKDVDALSTWIAGDAPTRAELQCDLSNKNCKDALKALQKKGVDVTTTPNPNNTVMLVYERILARDCDQHYRDPSAPNYNSPAPSFGCALSANIVQHVSDKSAFINPGIMDTPTSKNAVSAAQRAYSAREYSTYGVGESLTEKAKTE